LEEFGVVRLGQRDDPAAVTEVGSRSRTTREPRFIADFAPPQQPPHSLKNAPGPPQRPAVRGAIARDAAADSAAAVAAAAEPATEPAAVAAAVTAALAASGAAAAVAAADRADAVVWRRHDRRVGQPDRRVPHRRPGDAGRRERAGHALQWVQ